MSTPILNSETRAIVGIDFGTTGSGFCVYELKSSRFYWNNLKGIKPTPYKWRGRGDGNMEKLEKTPTELLIGKVNPNTGVPKVYSWGVDCNKQFNAMEARNVRVKILRNLKMGLVERLALRDVDENDLDPVLVIGEYLKKMLKVIRSELTLINIQSLSEVKFVITIPANFKPQDEHSMRRACVHAGIVSNAFPGEEKLQFVPEPLSAGISIFKEDKIKKDEVMMIIDCGGGTIDISTHKSSNPNKWQFEEITSKQGKNAGSAFVNLAFQDWFSTELQKIGIDGREVKKNYGEEYEELLNEFEKLKLKFRGGDHIQSIVLEEGILEEIENKYDDLNDNEKDRLEFWIESRSESINFHAAVMKGFYRECTDAVVVTVQEQLDQLKESNTKVDYVYGVGGFCRSSVLTDEIKRTLNLNKNRSLFKKPANQVYDFETHSKKEVVLHGSVLLGLIPKVVVSRISKYSYGIAQRVLYDPLIHDPSKMKNVWGLFEEEKVVDIFQIYIKKGNKLTVGQEIEAELSPSEGDSLNLVLYTSDSDPERVVYIDDLNSIPQELTKHYSFNVKLEKEGGGLRRILLKFIVQANNLEIEFIGKEDTGKLPDIKLATERS